MLYGESHSLNSLCVHLFFFIQQLRRGHVYMPSQQRLHKILICFFIQSWSHRRTGWFLSVYLSYTNLWTTKYDFTVHLLQVEIIFLVCVLLRVVLYIWICMRVSIHPCFLVFRSYSHRADNVQNNSYTSRRGQTLLSPFMELFLWFLWFLPTTILSRRQFFLHPYLSKI